jgi:Histidine kinase-, DNA gyrase B-, and HSP90-like ATPase
LLVLAGAELRQRGGEPVPLVDVLRAAVSEIEDYQRVAISPLPGALVSSLAVNDVVHLIAELLENATAYSDPETQVSLSARVDDRTGLLVEIVDAGTGIRRVQLVDINQRLASPPAVDVSVSRQMGLYVVGRLASRHGISVVLASSHDFGVTATVSLPRELVLVEAPLGADRANDSADAQARQSLAQSVALPQPATLFGAGVGQAEPEDAFAQQVSLDDGLLTTLPSVNGGGDDTPIFNDMLSRWFTERHPLSRPAADDEAESLVSAELPPPVEPEPWESAADVGWQAAEAASEPTPDELTAAGLPKRRPQAFLVPGSAEPTPMANGQNGQAAPPPARHAAAAVRDRMSDFQRGLLRGRHTKPVRTVDDISSVDDDYPAEGDS